MNKKQIIFIRGGECFEKQEDFYKFLSITPIDPYEEKRIHWRDKVIEAISDRYDPIVPSMPARENSDYIAWKIWFEKHLDFIHDDNPIFVGTSLGGTFLLKYFSENVFNKKISQLHLVAPCVTNEGQDLERLSTFEFDVTKINVISDICSNVYLWHSKDDLSVPIKNSEIVKEYLPNAEFHIFDNLGHFQIESFPEILEVIKQAK